jgi:formylglycine-generating enzyme required for sulfatase activity
MSYCLNLACQKPQNPDNVKFCGACGQMLLLRSHYVATRLLGQGGFGKTFLAIDRDLPSQPRRVIKQFAYNDPGTAQRALGLFAREAEQLESLNHPQIPKLLGHFEENGQFYTIQEFVDGEDLEKSLSLDSAYTEAKVKAVLQSILPILDYIHSRKIIHRDIKPANIMRRSADKQLFLIDFGAVMLATGTALAKTGTVIGSPEYAAPEQTRGKPNFASDIYSLGVTCIHLLTKIPPFDLYDDYKDDWDWKSHLSGNSVSAGFAQILDKLIARKLSVRYTSAAKILQDLNPGASARQPVNLPPPPVATSITSLFRQSLPPVPSAPQSQGKSFSEMLAKDNALEMIAIPSGEFMMGGSQPNEQPIHKVKLKAFLMGKYPVTQKQWQAIMGNNPSKFPRADSPVEQVSWKDAQEFCQKLSQKTGKKYRLPSEAEWEYACRAGSKTEYYFGDDAKQLGDYAWYNENSNQKTHVVGQKKSNAWGLYDMHGNVWEWCEDIWHGDYEGAPTDGSA